MTYEELLERTQRKKEEALKTLNKIYRGKMVILCLAWHGPKWKETLEA